MNRAAIIRWPPPGVPPSISPLSAPDLTKLQIDRNAPRTPRRGRRWWVWIVGFALLAAAGAAAVGGWFGAPIEVQTVTVTTAYPTQAITALNATGYVVAQRLGVLFLPVAGGDAE